MRRTENCPKRNNPPEEKLANLFLNLSSLTNSITEIIKLSSANLTASYNLNLVYNRRVERENSFNTASVSYTSNCECFADTG